MFGFALAIPVCYAKNGLPDFIELFPDLSTLNETGIIFTRIPLNMSAGAGYALIFKQELKDSGQHNDSTLVYLHIDEDTSSWITSDSSSITSVSSLQPSVTSATDDNHTISNSSDGSDSHLNGFAGTLWTSVLVGLTAIGCCLIAYVFIRKWVKGLRSNAAIGSDLAKMQVEFAVTVAAEENQDCQDNSEDEVEVFRPHSACSLGDGKVECEGVQSILKQSTVLGRQQRYRNYDRGSPVGMGVGYGGGIGIASGVDSISGRGAFDAATTSSIPTVGLWSLSSPPYFDICNVCLSTWWDPTSYISDCSLLAARLTSECGIDNDRPIHVLPGMLVPLNITFNSYDSYLDFTLQFTELSLNVDYLALSNQTVDSNNGRTLPLKPVAFVLNYTVVIPTLPKYGNNSGYSLDYGIWNSATANYSYYIFRNITIDSSKSWWVTVQESSSGNQTTGSGSSASVPIWLIVFSTLVSASIVFIVGGYLLMRYRSIYQKASRETPLQGMKDIDDVGNYAEAVDEHEFVVYVRNDSGSFAPSVRSAASAGNHNGSTTGRKSALKTSIAEANALVAQIYDPTVHQTRVPVPSASTVRTSTEGGIPMGRTSSSRSHATVTKKVVFKETVDTAIVDLTQPPADDAVPEKGLFDDSLDGDIGDEEQYVNEFDDGGIERNVRETMKIGEALASKDDDDSESDNSDVSDSWRNGE
ncbi:hypothetical protein HDU84_000076 [Entophlyctis sp. JEL0112]|nr:hypothetical protein HDU84_000076 [Entophlyctis sp. JEL0112]